VVRINPSLSTALKDRVSRDQGAVLKDADLVGKRMDLHRSTAGRIRNAVSVAADADHAFPRYATLQLENGFERCQWQWPQVLSFLGKGLVDDAQGCACFRGLATVSSQCRS